jgi:4,4'-diaponeurosporenoate glycosyltransferase
VSTARLAVEALRWSLGWWLLWRTPAPGGTAPLDGVSVVVPARDEADNLGRLLPSLPAGLEVVVVDDGSTDGTAEVARRHNATVVRPGDPPPEGWTGKAWACWHGAQATRNEQLVFLDADVVVAPGGLEAAVAEHGRLGPGGGLVSVQPWHAVERPYEQLSAFFNLIAPMSIDAFTPRRPRPTGAFGPCLVVDRATYERSGGHGAEQVRGAVLDDVQIARAVRDTAGAPVHVFAGRRTNLTFRMYPHGAGQLAEGWTKNFAGGAAGTRPLTLVLVTLWLSGAIAAIAAVVAAPVLYAAYAVQLAVQLRRVGRFSPFTAALYPIPLAFFVGVFLRSLFRTYVRRQVTWRGRTVPTRTRT